MTLSLYAVFFHINVMPSILILMLILINVNTDAVLIY